MNKEGRARKIDGLELFSGHKAYAMKYASEELLDWWKLNPRLTQAEYESQWITGEMTWQND